MTSESLTPVLSHQNIFNHDIDVSTLQTLLDTQPSQPLPVPLSPPQQESLPQQLSYPRVVKRANVVPWDDYFMSVAFLSAMRSKDPSTQVGACIVNPDKRIVGIGTNILICIHRFLSINYRAFFEIKLS